MGRRAAPPQLVLPIVLLVTVLLTCCVRAMPRTGGPILFLEDQLGAVWDRFRTSPRTPVPMIASRFGGQGSRFSPRLHARRQTETESRLERLEIPPPSRRFSAEETKPARRTFVNRRRSSGASSAIIFPGQEGYEAPWASRTTEPTVLKPVATDPVEGRTPGGTLVDAIDIRVVTTPLEGSPDGSPPAVVPPPPPPAEEGPTVPECGGVQFRAFDPASGRCRPLAMRSGCAPGEWFVLDRVTREAACRPYPCPIGEAMLDGACHNLSDSASVCAQNMVLQVDEFGDAACDCKKGCVYWPAEERCYPALLRGPCSEGQQLVVRDDGPACVPNPCGREGWARWPETGKCHRLLDTEDAPCAHGRMEVDPTTLQLVCVDAVPNSVFTTRSVRCAVGSRRSFSGECRRTIRAADDQPRPTSGPCSPGFVEAPDGGCRREIRPGLSFLG